MFTLKSERDMAKTYSQVHHTDKYSQHNPIIWPVWLNGWISSKEFFNIQAAREFGFTLKRVRDMTRTYSQMHHINQHFQHSSIVGSAWPNVLSKGFWYSGKIVECRFTLKRVRDIRRYNQIGQSWSDEYVTATMVI